jgi:hypothetical protein
MDFRRVGDAHGRLKFFRAGVRGDAEGRGVCVLRLVRCFCVRLGNWFVYFKERNGGLLWRREMNHALAWKLTHEPHIIIMLRHELKRDV